ncbi:hypothetical protein ACEWY4_017082 [Coilia grayii]|uniref:NACHT domain-containing protein n=1 Tax=Coilia grayii TaxID=363190 RepID=A0ABD1JFT2_9TELE
MCVSVHGFWFLHRYQPASLSVEMQQIHKSHLQEKFQCLVEGSIEQGNPTPLSKVYTELYITEGGGGRVNDEHEVRQIERASWREAAGDKPIKCSDIFTPLSGQVKPTRTVLTKGVAGIGKTVSVQKFILDWAKGNGNRDINFIFPLPFRELNLMKDKKISLVNLIQHYFSDMTNQQIFTSSEHRVLFIFDGLDECRLPLHFDSNPRCCDVTESASVDVLLTNLIKGNLVPSALLWITTRPAAAGQIPPQCVDQVTEIRGFSGPQKADYFVKRISDEDLASRTIAHLKSSRSLFIMCYIPIFCWIAATVVEGTSEESDTVEMPRTLTQMYTHFLIIQTSIKKNKYTDRKERDDEIIFKLGKLAFQQLEEGNLIFYEEDLRECGIDVTEASVISGVCTQIFREEKDVYREKVFSFVHLSIQEFLAALYVFLCFSSGERNMSDQQQTSQLSALFRAATLYDLHKTAVDLALQSKNGHLDLFLRFLLGLSLESNQSLLKHLLPHTSSQSQSLEQTVKYVKQKIRDQSWFDRRINLFYCLNELNQHAVVEDINRSSESLSVEMLLPGQWETKRFEFKMSGEQLDEFDLQKYMKTPEQDQTELLSPDEVLQRLVLVVTASTSARLIKFNLTEKSGSCLASALTSPASSLTQLDLCDNKLLGSGLEIVCAGVCHENSKLQQLHLSECNLTEKSCSCLASVLTSHSSRLTRLNLRQNKLLDSGVELLCSGLQHRHCKLEQLQLSYCDLTESSCSCLSSAVSSHCSSLTALALDNNRLLDSGVKHLCRGLRNQNCRLQHMQLNSCNLTEKSCSYLASVLTSRSSSLRRLDLSYNELLDSGVQLLCSALRHRNCKMEQLELKLCKLTEKSCSCLASVLTSHSSSLTQLNLSSNKLLDSGVEVLCDGLRHQNCKLDQLQLNSCNLTEKSCSHVASVLTSRSSSLRRLDLSYNELLDSGVELLCSALRHRNCKLEQLELWKCKLTEKSCSCLASVLTSRSSRLRQLELTNNKLLDSGVELLCRGLRDQNCKLEQLQ